MSLPIRTVIDDVDQVCGYLARKPTGSTVSDARKVISPKHLDGRKLAAMKFWGLIDESDGRMKNTEQGRQITLNQGANKIETLRNVVKGIPPYNAILERAVFRHEDSLSATDVAAHWHEHFPEESSPNDRILNDQAVCFFQLAQAAALGEIVIGRRGNPTRFQFTTQLAEILGDVTSDPDSSVATQRTGEHPSSLTQQPKNMVQTGAGSVHETKSQAGPTDQTLGQAIFIAHGKNKKPMEQLKSILDKFKVPYRVATDEPNLGRPISTKVRETMLACNCAILIFTADEEFQDATGKQIWRPSENVVYELGASGYLYGKRIVIMKEDGVTFPSNFSDLGYISFAKDALGAKTMEVLSELIGFGIVKIST